MEGVVELELRISDREHVVVPAGTFNAFRVEAKGWLYRGGADQSWNWKTWYAPDQVRRPVAHEQLNRNRKRIINSTRLELTAFHQS